MTGHHLFPYFLILTAGLLWGVTFSLALIATAGGAHPLALVSWQLLMTVFIYVVVCLVSKVPMFRLVNFRHYLVLAVIGITVPNLLYYNAAPHLSAGILSITIATVPMFTYAIMLILSFESLIMKRLTGILLGLVAIVLLVVPDQGLSSDDASWWTLVVLVCAWLYSVENVYIGKAIRPAIDVRELLFGSNLLAAAILFPLTLYLDLDKPVEWLISDAGLAISGITLASAIAYAIFFYTIQKSGPVFASQCGYVITVTGVIWGIVIFGEEHTWWIWASVIIMMFGLMLVTPGEDPVIKASIEPVTESGNA